jgi:hypothetical protein
VWSLVWASVACERRREALGSSIAVDAISWRCRFRPLNHSSTRRHLAGALYAYLFLDDFVLLSPVYTLLFADAGFVCLADPSCDYTNRGAQPYGMLLPDGLDRPARPTV